ncbi:MAG: SDR family NAD(P)-dependent oxidoreductase [Ancrocorticia sp.]|uniref:SDR family NAD(P)-dependent oxidoreductase n=1 Tax=Ancrocorticia sp. TaxID=2593684 RepID=UPI003F93264B
MNRLAVITGGTKGLGRAVAERLLAEGFDVLLSFATDHERARAVGAELRETFSGSEVFTIQADASSMDSVDAIESFLESHGRRVDVLILNAGLTARGSLEELDIETWDRVFRANVDIPVFTIQRLLDRFAPNASIVFTGSLMGEQPHSMSLAYGVSKSAVHALVKNLVKFLAPRGIRVNAVAPGFIDTEWQLAKPDHVRDSINSKISLGRFATPEEVTDPYAMLVNNPYITGETITIDGGYSYR